MFHPCRRRGWDNPAMSSGAGGPGVLEAPPADSEQVGGDSARAQHRREYVESLVGRSLAPAVGLAARVLDPLGEDPEGRDRARLIATDSIRSVALGRRRFADATARDDEVREVMGRVAEASLESLIGHPGSVMVEEQTGVGVQGTISFAAIQDTTSPMRRTDRRVAFVVLAAGLPPEDACVLLGLERDALTASLRRVSRRLADSEDSRGARGEDPL